MAPLFAVGTQARFFSSCFLGATSVVTLFSAELFVEMVEREKVTYASLLPATTFRMVKEFLESSNREYDLSSLCKFQPEGGQHCSGDDLKAILDYFNIPYTHVCKPFGMTEAMPAAYLVPEDVAAGLKSNATEKEKRDIDRLSFPHLIDYSDSQIPSLQLLKAKNSRRSVVTLDGFPAGHRFHTRFALERIGDHTAFHIFADRQAKQCQNRRGNIQQAGSKHQAIVTNTRALHDKDAQRAVPIGRPRRLAPDVFFVGWKQVFADR